MSRRVRRRGAAGGEAARISSTDISAEMLAQALPDERIVYTRTLPAAIPALYTPEEYARLTAGRTLHELGPISNICADWGRMSKHC